MNAVAALRLHCGGRPYLLKGRWRVVLQSHRCITGASATPEKTFDKVLIANRGEIACRIMRTCKRLGIKTVAIHSDVDSRALHVQLADEAVMVGPAPSAKSYLNMDAILEAVKSTGAQAVHPGYGFLSENCHFAQRLEAAGVTFVGPNVHAIEAMGDKIQSKLLARRAGVHTVPGFDGEIKSVPQALEIANQITYPVMVKASAGGGGKGMRIAWNDKECTEAYTLCKQEAASSFGDDRLLIEKYIDNPRHIEIQVLADKLGNGIFLNERECSIQRRNQKVVEEAPSIFLDAETRKAMGAQALMLAKAVNYDSAGTVEFLVDSQRNFYFLEMNTRLQVEHPITEYITGVDIVEHMLRSAAGKQLSLTQADIGIKGWALECRVYAEDSTKMLPSIGYLERYIQPVDHDNDHSVRVDTGVVEGSEISIYYDPMICKLVTYGENREMAIRKMKRALDSYFIKGVQHNIPLLRDVVSQPRFASGNITTKFLPEVYPGGFHGIELEANEKLQLLATSVYVKRLRQLRATEYTNALVATQLDMDTRAEFVLTLNGTVHQASILRIRPDVYEVTVDGQTMVLEGKWKVDSPLIEIMADGQEIVIQDLDQSYTGVRLGMKGSSFDIRVLTPAQHELYQRMPARKVVDTSKIVTAPMPGSVVSLAVKEGDMVSEGQEVAIVEAMKMQNSLRAQRSGKVKAVHVKAGQSVAVDEVMIEFADS